MVPIPILEFTKSTAKNNPDTDYDELVVALRAALKRKNNGAKCYQCSQPIWAAGSAIAGTDMCFTCITESDDSEDYKVF